ncbi:MAG: 4Fe-4S cluster-binding domain-containing protein [Lachnospiraceae bacterium]|nr:4Fe-4S cluster-binding domain-containing protein [Lachnospiraceae bacterium]
MTENELKTSLCECYRDPDVYNKKYSACFCGIELTRRCNLNCIHCYKGDAQDLDIDPQFIDSVLDQIDTIYHLGIAGGEPSLALGSLRYLLDSLRRHNTYVGKVTITTNAVILSEEFRDLFYSLRAYSKNPNHCRIIVSNDRFHKDSSKMTKTELETHCKFYRNGKRNIITMQDCNKRMGLLKRAGRLSKPPKCDYKKCRDDLTYRKDYIDRYRAYASADPAPIYKNSLQHYGNHICAIIITTKGNVFRGDMVPYEDEDTNIWQAGHITESLDTILKRDDLNLVNTFISYVVNLKDVCNDINNIVHGGFTGILLFIRIDFKLLEKKDYLIKRNFNSYISS